MKKKGFFFTLDVITALSIVALGFFVVATSVSIKPQVNQVTVQLDSIESYLSQTKIEDVNSPLVGVSGQLWNQGEITNRKNTLLQQVGEFSDRGAYDLGHNFSREVIEALIPAQYYFSIIANNTVVYPRNWSNAQAVSYNATNLVASRSTIQYGITNSTQLWGPITVRLLLWRR